MKRLLVGTASLAAAVLLLPAAASAHAIVIRTVPADGSILVVAPREVTVVFDDSIRSRSGNAAIANRTGATVLTAPAFVSGDTLHLPLRRSLSRGAYTIRWSIASEDGHPEQGVLAFAVGAGSAIPRPALAASVPLSWFDMALRALYLFGALVAAGAVAFALLVSDLLRESLRRPLAQLLFAGLFASFLGASGLEHAAASGTRFALLTRVAAVLAVVGAGSAALALAAPTLLLVAGASAVALLTLPAFAGHALDTTQPKLLAVGVDLVHLGAAAVWLGGLVALVYVLPRATADDRATAVALRRFSTTALAAVALLGASGIGRALTELGAVSQIWSTSYGRALIVKSALFAAALALGWGARRRLAHGRAASRPRMLVEIVVLTAVIAAVGVLTDLRPGVERAPATTPRSTLR